MSGGIRSGPQLFEVLASDGRWVSLHLERYQFHILDRKKEFTQGWLAEPLEAIKRALKEAVQVLPQPSGRLIYVGPAIGSGFLAHNCIHVVVQPTGPFRGVVVTAVMK